MEKGLIHIYCGDGKGKTSAATGLAVRAAGCGKQVLFARFLKNEESGELEILDRIPEIHVIHLERSFGFYRTLTEEEQAKVRQTYEALWHDIVRMAETDMYDVLVMDEFMAAYNYGLIGHDAAFAFLREKPARLEVVLTGRDPDEDLVELADYVSEIRKVKHPFDRGIRARRGIEY